jgi:glutamate racemase
VKLGVFDSGVGGLSVVHHINSLCPESCQILYRADTKNVPYGLLPLEFISHNSVENCTYLKNRGATDIVLACNTAYGSLKKVAVANSDITLNPVTATVASLSSFKRINPHICVLATNASIRSKIYFNTISTLLPSASCQEISISDLISHIEFGDANPIDLDGYFNNYLLTQISTKIPDVVILGSTHLSFLGKYFSNAFKDKYPNVQILDSSYELAKFIVKDLLKRDISIKASVDYEFNKKSLDNILELTVTGDIKSFSIRVSELFNLERKNLLFLKNSAFS